MSSSIPLTMSEDEGAITTFRRRFFSKQTGVRFGPGSARLMDFSKGDTQLVGRIEAGRLGHSTISKYVPPDSITFGFLPIAVG